MRVWSVSGKRVERERHSSRFRKTRGRRRTLSALSLIHAEYRSWMPSAFSSLPVVDTVFFWYGDFREAVRANEDCFRSSLLARFSAQSSLSSILGGTAPGDLLGVRTRLPVRPGRFRGVVFCGIFQEGPPRS